MHLVFSFLFPWCILWGINGEKLGFNAISDNVAFGVEIMDIDVRISIWFVADRVFGPHTNSDEVYEVAAKPVVKAAMEGVNGRRLYYIQNCVAMGMWCF